MTSIPISRIVISHVRPPIPTKDFDYCAYYEGEAELQQYGWGSTPEEAQADLLELFESGFFESPSRSYPSPDPYRPSWKGDK